MVFDAASLEKQRRKSEIALRCFTNHASLVCLFLVSCDIWMHHRKQWFTNYCRWINMWSPKQTIHCTALGDMWAIHPACISWAGERFCHFEMILQLTAQSPNQSIPSKDWWWWLKKETSRKFKKQSALVRPGGWIIIHTAAYIMF